MNLKVAHSESELRALGQTWNSLLSQSANNHVFLTHEWITAWWNLYGSGKELMTLVAEENGRAVGIAPLYRTVNRRGPLTTREIRFLADHGVGSDFLNFIIPAGREEAVLPFVLDSLWKDKSWTVLNLNDMEETSPNPKLALEYAHAKGAPAAIRRLYPCPWMPLPETWDEFMKIPDTVYKKIIRRECTRKLCKQRVSEAILSLGPDSLDEYLELLFKLNTERWRKEGEEGSFTNETKRQFYKDVSKTLAKRDWLRLAALKVDGKIEAMEFDMRYGDRHYFLQGGCTGEGLKLRAGNFLVYRIFQSLVGSATEAHFLRGAEGYKYQWGCKDKWSVGLKVYRGLKGRALYAIDEAKYAGKTITAGIRPKKN